MNHTKPLEQSFERSAKNAVGKILLASGFSSQAAALVSVELPTVLISRKERAVSSCTMAISGLDLAREYSDDPAIIDTLLSRLLNHAGQHGITVEQNYLTQQPTAALDGLKLKAEGIDARERIGATLNGMLAELGAEDHDVVRPEPLSRFETHGSQL